MVVISNLIKKVNEKISDFLEKIRDVMVFKGIEIKI